MLPVNGGDMTYPSHLLECVGVHGLLSQETVSLAQPSLQCEGLPGVYSTIWCICYKPNKLESFREEGDNGPSQIGRAKGVTQGQHRDSPAGHRGMAPPPSRARIRRVGTAWPGRRRAGGRGHVASV